VPTSGGSLASPPDLSAVGAPSLAALPPVRLEPRARAAASPTSSRNTRPGTHLPAGVPSSLTAMWECRRAWARTQQQLELEVWPC
jgi:hypothetical protein